MRRIHKKWTCSLVILQLLGCILSGQNSESIRDRYVEAVLISEGSHVQPGKPFRVGLLLKHDPHWHTYWKSSSTGYATSIDWNLPEGFSAGPIDWPVPQVYNFQGWIEYVYEGETLLPVSITPPQVLPDGEIEIGFSADWLMCKDICVPGGIKSVLRLPVKNTPPVPSPDWSGIFGDLKTQLPGPAGDLSLQAWRSNGTVSLRISGEQLPESITFFDDQKIIDPATGSAVRDGDSLQLRLVLADNLEANPARLTGVIRAQDGWASAGGSTGISIDVPISDSLPQAGYSGDMSWFGILLLAFAGGMILNLMPCVFPVLGIKIMGFVNQAGESRGKVMTHGLVFSGGVLLSFWTLAAVLLILRSGGSQLGWGFQLQSPAFVLALTMLLFAFALNMSGLFEVGQSAVGVGSGLTAKSGLAGSFFSGVLATVVATPCAAPFLAPALGAALALPPAASLAVFTFIALGLAMPYLVLSAFPTMIRWLPRPGQWMETFKQVMSFLLYATVAYLVWVLAGQLTDEGGFNSFALLKVLLSLVVLAFGLWIYGRWAAFHRPKPTRYIAVAASAILAIAAISIGFGATQKTISGEQAVKWEKWEPGKAEELVRAGNIVYVDFTARWCVTCQTNKAAVFSSAEVLRLIADSRVILLKADWTHQDPRISEALAAYNRSAVPFNLVYGPALSEPIILPEFLTPGPVLEALRRAANQ